MNNDGRVIQIIQLRPRVYRHGASGRFHGPPPVSTLRFDRATCFLPVTWHPQTVERCSVPHPLQKTVQSHDILYRVSQDIPYTPSAEEASGGERCLGGRWIFKSNGCGS